jgi:hypothetical protein
MGILDSMNIGVIKFKDKKYLDSNKTWTKFGFDKNWNADLLSQNDFVKNGIWYRSMVDSSENVITVSVEEITELMQLTRELQHHNDLVDHIPQMIWNGPM